MEAYDPEASRWTATTFLTPDVSEIERAHLEAVAMRLGAWWHDGKEDSMPPAMPRYRYDEIADAYRDRFGEQLPRMQLMVISDRDCARLMLRALRTGVKVVPPDLPPGAVT